MSVKEVGDNLWQDDYGYVIGNVHKPTECKNDYCTIHRPSSHHVLDLPQRWRNDLGFMERICNHGIGHPDPDEIKVGMIHGCDGCCVE